MREAAVTKTYLEGGAEEAAGTTVAVEPVIFVVMQTTKRANGGVESVTRVIENLRHIKPVVVTQAETPFNDRWRAAGCEVHVWPAAGGRGWAGASALAGVNLRMARLVRRTRCRVVHCNDILALWHAGFGARLAGARVVFNVRNIKPATQPYGWRWRVARRIGDRQLVLSEEMRAALVARLGLDGASAGAVEHIYSMTDLPAAPFAAPGERAALRARLGIGESCFAVGYVAAFDPRKGQLEFITGALPELREAVPAARVFFLGDFQPERDDYARRCLAQVEEAGLGRMVSFAGHTAEVSDWYRALDVVVVASRNEGLARCMIESVACGTPVVSFDVCSAREILEGHDCGAVVAQGDYSALVERISDLARDEDERRRLGENGVRAAAHLFEPSAVAAQYERLYLSLLGPRTKS
jgi:glycosyltransferase involved in cell wall biosynthesis